MSKDSMGARRRARELALQMMFQAEFAPPSAAAEILKRFQEEFDVPKDVVEYAELLTQGIFLHKDQIDGAIQSASAHWKIQRMALVDLNVMRIAVFEMKFAASPLPPKVAINEAVEIAKRYGSTDSGSFVNGILDQTSKG
jgi:transcription antitermination protein NusB